MCKPPAMYKSKYEIPFVIENPAGFEEKRADSDSLAVLKFIFLQLQSLVLFSIHLLWALLVGIFSFIRSTWRDNPWLQSLPWIRLSVLAAFAYFVWGGSLDAAYSSILSSYTNQPINKSAAILISSNGEEGEKKQVANKREQDLSPIAPALLNNPSVQSFINRFKDVAREEMKLYGIPASIKMGQAIIESQAGKSVLARKSNNYFGIKCKSKCLGCTCKNYADDNKYDMFRVFDSAWESFRAHSKLLCNPRYKKLPLYGKDYKKWAKGLKKAGYATDPAYAEKLISVIEKYNLTMLDQ